MDFCPRLPRPERCGMEIKFLNLAPSLDSALGEERKLLAVNELKAPLDHLSIGEFSRRTRLSLKALRLYDAMGLLPPRT